MLPWAPHSWRQASCAEHVYGNVQSARSLRSVGGSGGHGSAHPSAAAGHEDGERQREGCSTGWAQQLLWLTGPAKQIWFNLRLLFHFYIYHADTPESATLSSSSTFSFFQMLDNNKPFIHYDLAIAPLNKRGRKGVWSILLIIINLA